MAEVWHSPEYYRNSDIDWFCRINGTNIHVASMGRQVPEGVAATLPKLYEQVSEIDMAEWCGAESVWYNEVLLRMWLRIEDAHTMARYLYTFVVMARKGFYSFAPITSDSTVGDYFLMAKPVEYDDREFEGIVSRDIEHFNINTINAFTPVRLVEMLNE